MSSKWAQQSTDASFKPLHRPEGGARGPARPIGCGTLGGVKDTTDHKKAEGEEDIPRANREKKKTGMQKRREKKKMWLGRSRGLNPGPLRRETGNLTTRPPQRPTGYGVYGDGQEKKLQPNEKGTKKKLMFRRSVRCTLRGALQLF